MCLVVAAAFTLAISMVALAVTQRMRFPFAALPILTGLVLVTAAVHASSRADSPLLFLYTWLGLAAWFLLTTSEAVAITLTAVVLSGTVIGTVEGLHGDGGEWWLMTTATLLAMSAVAGVAQRRAQRDITRLQEVASRDELTGLLNRRGHQQRLDVEVARARRYDEPLSVVFGDLDRFKSLNDRFGHREGDRALQCFADICRRHLRDVDFAGRLGGEEFLIVLPNTDIAGAFVTAERIRLAVSYQLRDPDGNCLSASFGVATLQRSWSSAELVDHADQAMYAAKESGRDCTVAFGRRGQDLEQQ